MSMAPHDSGSGSDEVPPPSDEVVFHRVARSGQVPDGYVRRFYVGDLECAVARLGGKAYATSNYCTHLDCLLSSGKLIDDGIKCSCHGSVFDLDTGEPIYPPATEPIQVYPVREEDGEIFVGVTEADVESGGPRRRRLRRD
ncbi:Rieske (2Fe-2S) protein [Nocardioides halotolerans]|jgi:nitrite reductase/ring-hydroxylating ferredoxin subunit|uniref:Rieske (2Fe-2S) protein n=1 Tax=Nocardioides halotolerans TaxID=433660 RepID=UPI000416863F|nr:Rieske 2Fe-2S domain-containing protein [Nocardioides halotolerans]